MEVLRALAPQFECTTGHHLSAGYDPTNAIKRQIEDGAVFDVAIVTRLVLDDLTQQGIIAPDTRANIARCGLGIAVRKGAPKPDIGTTEAFKQTLLKAKSVTYLKEGASTIHLRKLFVQLGIAEAIRDKAVETEGEMVSELVAEGKVELGLIVVPNIMSVPGAELVGPLPKDINSIVMFTAGVSAISPNQQAARELIKLLKSPEAKPVIQAKGNDPA